jgi:hypothetical protein
MGRVLAGRLLHKATDDGDRLDRLFRLLASRKPNSRERTACMGLLETLTQRYSESPEEARQLLSTGPASRDNTLNVVEHAAWTQVAITVLASDVSILLY